MSSKLAASLLALSCVISFGQSPASNEMAPGPTSEPKKPISFDLSGIDRTADPCVDFYQYACGNWKKNNPIPGDQVRWGRFNELTERNLWLLYQELKTAADAPKTPLQKKIWRLLCCMHECQISEPVRSEADRADFKDYRFVER